MMELQVKWGDRGQVLVQVALGLVVLLLVVGLAIDGGNAYGERRAMQNAADAGALAGARAICEGLDGDAARGWAQDYADRNGADLDLTEVVVNMDEGTVNVTARKEVGTFLMGLAGFDTIDVGAEAEAVCSLGDVIGGLWPIAFDVTTWSQMFDQCPEDPGPGDEGSKFMVWVDDNIDEDVAELCDLCDCEGTDIEAYGGAPFGSGDRGWVRLQNPPDPWPQYQNGDNCGASALNTWLEHGYTGPIAIDQCVATQSGVTASGLNVVESREGEEVNILLYDTEPVCDATEVVGYPDNCPGDFLRVKGFGCIKVEKMDDKFTLEDHPDAEKGDCPVKNEKVIYVTVMCDCDWSASGSAGGGSSGPGVPAVSLIK